MIVDRDDRHPFRHVDSSLTQLPQGAEGHLVGVDKHRGR